MRYFIANREDRIWGPYSLRYVHLFIESRSPGAFILSRDGKMADLVGHSSDDLAKAIGRLKQGTDYRYFWFSYAKSRKKASELASYWHHRYRPSDNHPPDPSASRSGWRCTIQGCTACALGGVTN